jgi:small subunit ribosomal protein S5
VEGTSIPHVAIGRFGSGKVLMKPADKGHGIIAAGAVRAVMEAAGIMDISVKCIGSRNPNNLVRSTLDGLYNLRSNDWIAIARGKDIDYLKQ